MNTFYKQYLEIMGNLLREFDNAFSGLPQEALDWVPGEDMNSLCVLVVHTAGATRFWIGDVAMGEPSGRDRAAEFKAHGLDETALKKRFEDIRTYTQGALERMTLTDLEKSCTNPRDGSPTTAGWALLHALEHIGVHLGHAQITRQLWDQQHPL